MAASGLAARRNASPGRFPRAIGGGNVGATCAYQLAARGVADVAIYDILEGVPAGKALDMTQVGPVFGFDGRVTGSHDVSIIEGSEVVVVTAGFPRKPGMDRMDLLKKNADIANASGEAITTSVSAWCGRRGCRFGSLRR